MTGERQPVAAALVKGKSDQPWIPATMADAFVFRSEHNRAAPMVLTPDGVSLSYESSPTGGSATPPAGRIGSFAR